MTACCELCYEKYIKDGYIEWVKLANRLHKLRTANRIDNDCYIEWVKLANRLHKLRTANRIDNDGIEIIMSNPCLCECHDEDKQILH